MQLARIFPRAVVRLACDASDEHVTLRVEASAQALDGSVLAGLLEQTEPPSRRRGLDLASRLRMSIVQELLAAHGGLLRAQGDDGCAAFLVRFDALEDRASLPMLAPQLEALRMRFLAAVGHDLRSPLNAIQGFTDLLLLDDAVTGSARESLTIVQRAAQELLTRIDRMVEWARERAQQPQT
jgi:signal transduction histidine kinase